MVPLAKLEGGCYRSSTANARYEMQSSGQAMRAEEDGIEFDRLDQDRAVSGLESSNGLPAEDKRNEVPQ